MAENNAALGGKVALVTGASSGLGRATAVAFARSGANVGVMARSEPELERVVAEIETYGKSGLALPVDLAAGEKIFQAVQQLIERFGRIDVLVNAAATDVPGPVADLPVEGWDTVLDVNLRAPFILAKALFPHMRAQGSGTIINISSVAGKRSWPNAAAYSASKFGLTGLTQALNAEGRAYNIRACILYPGAMATHWGAWTPEERQQEQEETSPPPRKSLPPSEVADLIVWLAAAPPEFVLNEAVVSPLDEQGWP